MFQVEIHLVCDVLNIETRMTWMSSLKFEIRIANLGRYR